MTSQWVVTTATEKLTLDQSRTAEITFTVTNKAARVARTAFDIRTGDGVDTSWFTIDDPQRAIRPAASVPFPVRLAVPAQVAPGSYEFQARVCPPDAAPEENFVLSPRVLIEVPAPPAPEKKKWPWWLIAVAAGLLALVIGVVTWLVWPSGDVEPQVEVTPSPTPIASVAPIEYTTVPRLHGLKYADAVAGVQKAGLELGVAIHRFDVGGTDLVTRQSIAIGAQAAKGSPVNLEVSMPVVKPVITAPGNNSNVPPGGMPTVSWTDQSPVKRWLITVYPEKCVKTGTADSCNPAALDPAQLVTSRQHRPPMPALTYVDSTGAGWRHSGWVQVHVQAVDDVGNLTPAGIVRVYLEH